MEEGNRNKIGWNKRTADEAIWAVKTDSSGRVLLPIGIRYRLSLAEGDRLAVDQLGDGTIILKKIDARVAFEEWLGGEEAEGRAGAEAE